LRRKILLIALLFVAVVTALGLYVGRRAVRELSEARSALTASPTELSVADISAARDHLRGAAGVLDGLPAKLLSAVPVARQNLVALETAATEGIPVLDAAIELRRTVDYLGTRGLMDDGRVQIDAIHGLRRPLRAQIRTLDRLIAALESRRSGWLLPSLWDEVDGLLRRARKIQASARRATRVMAHADALLGFSEPRTYLVVLINNAELRAAGGIPSGLGTITVSDGAFEIGNFYYAPELRDQAPHDRVRAPRDFRRRFGYYLADTRFWVNTTFSPDIPDVALVSARLFRAATGIKSNGVLIADPRGVAALLAPSATITAPETGRVLTPEELPAYAYSGVYGEESTGLVADRHKALLQVGRLAFERIAKGDFGGADSMTSAGLAFAGGHLRFNSFDPTEQEALDAVGVTGDLDRPPGDNLLVTTWNSGGDKLDYWARRHIQHRCEIGPDGDLARCATVVMIKNVVAPGLPPTVANKPYGLMKTFVELLIPRRAALGSVSLNDERHRYYLDRQDGHSAVGIYVRIPQRETARVEVTYDLPIDDRYSLRAIPQPLAVDARLQIALEVPSRWTVRGLTPDGSRFTYDGALDRTLVVEAEAEDRPGIPGMWDRLVAFWREPLF
jgi:hypothetical protein